MKQFHMLSSKEQMRLVKALNNETLEQLTFYPYWEKDVNANIMVPYWISVTHLKFDGVYREKEK